MTVTVISTVTVEAGDTSLATLEEIKTELKIDPADTSNDTWLTRSIGQVSRSIAQYCNRKFALETLSDTIFVQQDPYPYQTPGGVFALQLSRWPITQFTGATQTLSATQTQALTQDKDFKLDRDLGRLFRLSPTGVLSNWEALPVTVVYEAGFDPVPDDVVVAAIRWLVWRWNERTRDPTLKATQQPDLGTRSYWVGGPPMSGGVPQEIAALLDNYRVPVVY
jgi:gp6-like head-tail connector protein